MTPVIFSGKEEDIGKIIPVKIIDFNRNTLFGLPKIDTNKKVA